MRSHRQFTHPQEEIGGTFKNTTAPQPIIRTELEPQLEDEEDLYSQLVSPSIPKRHSPLQTSKRFRAKQISEERLNQIAADLLELADELRSLHPDMADALDEAWHATDTALEVLLDDGAW